MIIFISNTLLSLGSPLCGFYLDILYEFLNCQHFPVNAFKNEYLCNFGYLTIVFVFNESVCFTCTYIVSDILVDLLWVEEHFEGNFHARCDVTLYGIDGEVWLEALNIPTESRQEKHRFNKALYMSVTYTVLWKIPEQNPIK